MLFCSAPLSSFVSGAIQVSHCDCDCDCGFFNIARWGIFDHISVKTDRVVALNFITNEFLHKDVPNEFRNSSGSGLQTSLVRVRTSNTEHIRTSALIVRLTSIVFQYIKWYVRPHYLWPDLHFGCPSISDQFLFFLSTHRTFDLCCFALILSSPVQSITWKHTTCQKWCIVRRRRRSELYSFNHCVVLSSVVAKEAPPCR